MKGVSYSKWETRRWGKLVLMDLVCFLLATILSFGLCYAYFSDQTDASGKATLGKVEIAYCRTTDLGTETEDLLVSLNGGSTTTLDNVSFVAGDSITIQGYAVNSSTVPVFALGRLEVTTARVASDVATNADIIDTEVIWFNISNNKPLYIEKGAFQIGASELGVGASQQLSIPYTFEGERYNNDYVSINVDFKLYSHQRDHLTTDENYNNYASVNGYSQASMFATHYMVKRYRDVWESEDANVAELTLSELKTDNSGAYLINSCKDWMIVRNTSTSENNYHNGKTFKLNAYLDFNNTTTATYIGTFKGNLDGQGYTISNWKDSAGIINQMYGDISNLGVDGFNITPTNTANDIALGALAGTLNSATISNCYAIGASAYSNSSQSDITMTAQSATYRIGGLVGNIKGDGTTASPTANIENSYAVANISVLSGTNVFVGGLVGAEYPVKASIDNCYFKGNISTAVTSASALICAGGASVTINNCFAVTTSITNSHADYLHGATSANITNGAYTNNSTTVKVGAEQTTRNVTISTFKSIGAMRDVFGWDTAIWGSNIFETDDQNATTREFNNGGLVVLRVFYNF